jgi:spore coat polysaccharide biosynthesis predicted glycosyltransferase SpsG
VTLLPITPALKSETVDSAIERIAGTDIDTMISVINQPRLSWKMQGGIYTPNDEKRVNTEQMEPLYIESGAFVISRAAIVTASSRIGKKVDIFETDKREAFEIKDYDDLRMAASYLAMPKVGIYVNGNNKIGMGHIYRELELADEFYVRPDIYYDANRTSKDDFGDTDHRLIPVRSEEELYNNCKKEQYNIFINDILSTSLKYMEGLRAVLPEAGIINFEDDGPGVELADMVFNALYEKANVSNVYAGEKYYIANKMFLMYEPIAIKEKVETVLISFGGADPKNYTERLIKIITKPEYKKIKFIVVLGRAKKNVDELMKYNRVHENIEVIYDVANMAKLMSSCDVAVTSRGRTGYELAILGIPTIAMAQNEREERHIFVSNENGFSYIGLDPADEVIEHQLKMYIGMSRETRQKFQNRLLSFDLRNGRKRVMGLINMNF